MKTLSRKSILEILARELPVLGERFGVERIALFGSFADGSPTDASDIDILVHLSRPLGFDFVELAYHLEDVLGRQVDLTTNYCLDNNRKHPRYQRIAENVKGSLVYA